MVLLVNYPLASELSILSTTSVILYIKRDGSLWRWQLIKDDNTDLDATSYTGTYHLSDVKLLDDVSTVTVGYVYSLALKTDGSLWDLGADSPVKILDGVKTAIAGGFSAYAIKTDGSLWAWGTNNGGLLGIAELL